MKTLGWVFVVLLLLGAGVILFPLHTFNKTIETGYGVVDKTMTANNAIYNYEWFKRQNESIKALGNKYNIAKTEYDAYTGNGWQYNEEKARLNTVKIGIQYQLEDAVSEYNARTKMVNRNIFADGLLPSYIDVTTFIFKP